jgi:hypothetical protein
LLSAEIQALREQVSAVATDAGRMKMLSEVHLTFMKFARDIVPEQAFLDGIPAAAIPIPLKPWRAAGEQDLTLSNVENRF